MQLVGLARVIVWRVLIASEARERHRSFVMNNSYFFFYLKPPALVPFSLLPIPFPALRSLL
jgi:hypothetical protein